MIGRSMLDYTFGHTQQDCLYICHFREIISVRFYGCASVSQKKSHFQKYQGIVRNINGNNLLGKVKNISEFINIIKSSSKSSL